MCMKVLSEGLDFHANEWHRKVVYKDIMMSKSLGKHGYDIYTKFQVQVWKNVFWQMFSDRMMFL